MQNENYTGVIPNMDANEDGSAAVKLTGLRKQSNDDEYRDTVDTESEEAAASKIPLTEDGTKVKFSKSARADGGLEAEENAAFNGEAKVAIESIERVPFAGMGKDELLKYVNDPYWVRLRLFFFILFWLLWLAMLAGAIGIVVLTPKCAPLPKRDWWQKSVHYQVAVPSYKDSDSDGYGDLQGLTSKLPYLVDAGIGVIWLSPIYTSPKKSYGYDIADFTSIDPTSGTMADFDALVKAAKASGLKLVVDFVPNHTSDQHKWFELSRNRTDPYTDYYIWADGKGANKREEPPNYWVTVYGSPAWAYDEVRQQFYYHSRKDYEPDLNLRNELLKQDLEKILKFWIDRGIDGFFIHDTSHLFENASLANESPSAAANSTDLLLNNYDRLNHSYTLDQDEIIPLLTEWRQVLNDYEAIDHHHRILITEASRDSDLNTLFFGKASVPLVDMTLHYQRGYPDNGFKLYDEVRGYLDSLPSYGWPNWLLGEKHGRMVNNGIDPNLLDGMHMLTMLVGGSSVTYYGQEIGLGETPSPEAVTLSPNTNVLHRNYIYPEQFALMQWDNSTNGGFSNATETWVPLNPNSTANSVQWQSGNPRSHLGIFKKLAKLRSSEPAIVYGNVSFSAKTNETLAFARTKKGSPGYVVVMNLSPHQVPVDIKSGCCETFSYPDSGQVVLRSSNAKTNAQWSGKIYFAGLTLGPYESIVITFIPDFKAN